jgi:endonuclease III
MDVGGLEIYSAPRRVTLERSVRDEMRREEKAERIQKVLDELYPRPPIPLDHVDPFTLLVAVVLSAQTTDKKVNEVSPRLFARASTPETMSELSVEEIRDLIREIGLAPQKAKSLRGLSRAIVELHGGKVPDDYEALIELPGVGGKTAQVVLCQAFDKPAFPVDTHIFRLAHRWGLSAAKTADKVSDDLKKVFPIETWTKLHLQIIYFGREHCPALRHDPKGCPICSWVTGRPRARAKARTSRSARNGPALRPADR